jgi:hypothetical protein
LITSSLHQQERQQQQKRQQVQKRLQEQLQERLRVQQQERQPFGRRRSDREPAEQQQERYDSFYFP